MKYMEYRSGVMRGGGQSVGGVVLGASVKAVVLPRVNKCPVSLLHNRNHGLHLQ